MTLMKENKQTRFQTIIQQILNSKNQSEEEEIRTLEPLDPQALSEEERLRERGWQSYMARQNKEEE